MNVRMRWNTNQVAAKLEGFHTALVEKAAFLGEQQTKANIAIPFEHKDGSMRGQIDTSAMINSVKANVTIGKTLHDAEVEVPVHYAQYQENIRAFMGPAVETVAASATTLVDAARKEAGVL